jgi:LEA14-like dessication related protein
LWLVVAGGNGEKAYTAGGRRPNMDPRERLLGSRRRSAATALGVVVVLVVAALVVGLLGVPSVVGAENRFGPVNESTTVVETELRVDNPNPVGVSLGRTDVNYTVYMNDVAMASGQRRGVQAPRGESTLPFRTAMDNERIPAWWVSHVSADGGPGRERTVVTVDAAVTSPLLGGNTVQLQQQRRVNTSIIDQFRSTEDRPIDAGVPLVSDPVLVVRETDAQWGTVTAEETPIDMQFVVYNPKQVPYVITEIGYEVTMNGVAVGSGATEGPTTIPPRSTGTVRSRTVIDNPSLDDWWVTHLENDQVTELRIDFEARLRLPNGETVRVPLDPLTYERTIETDVFDNKNGTGTAGGTETPAGTTTAGTTTAPGGTTTAPTGDTTTATTTTDDGELLDPTTEQGTTTTAIATTATITTGDGGLLNTTTDAL